MLKNKAIIALIGSNLNAFILIVQNFLFVPLYLNLIGEKLYGLWLASGAIIAWMGFFNMGIPSITTQRMGEAKGRKDHDALVTYFFVGFSAVCVMIVLITALSFMLACAFVSKQVEDPEMSAMLVGCIVVSAIAFGVITINYLLMGALQVLGSTLRPAVFSCIGSVAGIIVLVVGLYSGASLWSIAMAAITRGMVTMTPLLILALRKIRALPGKLTSPRKIAQEYLKLSPFTILAKSGGVALQKIEPLLFQLFGFSGLVIPYVMTQTGAAIVSGVMNRVPGALLAPMSQVYGENQSQRTFALFIRIQKFMICSSAVMMSVFVLANRSFVNNWVGREFFLGDSVTLAFAFMFMGSCLFMCANYFVGAFSEIALANVFAFGESVVRLSGILLCVYFGAVLAFPAVAACVLIIAFVATFYHIRKRLDMQSAPVATLLGSRLLFALLHITTFWVISQFLPDFSWIGVILLGITGTLLALALQVSVWSDYRGEFFAVTRSAALAIKRKMARKEPQFVG